MLKNIEKTYSYVIINKKNKNILFIYYKRSSFNIIIF